MKNQAIREAAKKSSVFLWEVAEALGINEFSLSRKLRHELPADETERILGIIAELAARKEGAQ